jgi:ATP-dependent DNA ligase
MQNGTIPASLIDGVVVFTKLEYLDARGKQRSWQITVKASNNDNKIVPVTQELLNGIATDLFGVIETASGIVDGKVREIVPTYVKVGKNLGKKNATTAITQAVRDALSLHNKQATAKSSAVAVPSASAGTDSSDNPNPGKEVCIMPLPMLAVSSNNKPLLAHDFVTGVFVQPKLDGCRCIASLCDGKEYLYTRGRKPVAGCNKIKTEMEMLHEECKRNLPLSPFFDGEIYIHGHSLQYISGQMRKSADDGTLEYHIYDVFFPVDENQNISYEKRKLYLDEEVAPIVAKLELKNIKLVPTVKVIDEIGLKKIYSEYLSKNYEGAIARKAVGLYMEGKNNLRSTDLIKYKPRNSQEYPVMGFTEGVVGKDLGAIIWECQTESGNKFTVVPNMELEARKKLFNYINTNNVFDTIKGLPLTVEYSVLSDGSDIPQQPRGIAFRTYEGDPRHEQLVKIYDEAKVSLT